jgi:cobalamin biosynthesis protein CobC
VLGPTYAEHARAAAMAGHTVNEINDTNALAYGDLAVVVNPNNPDGRVVQRATLLDIAKKLTGRGGLLVVDEAFMDVGPAGQSLAGDVRMPGLVVLRSFGKFFGMAGIRLGFALAEQRLAARLEGDLGPWAVSGPALEIGIRALADFDWQQRMRTKLAAQAARLDALFERFGIAVSGGTSLYRFLELAGSTRLFERLGQEGVLLRNFAWSRTALRCGLPADETAWQRLERGLALQESRRPHKIGECQ